MIDKIEAGRRVKAIRSDLGATQEDFAEMLCVTPQAVSKWETGRSLPDIDVLLKLSWIGKRTINQIVDANEASLVGTGVERALRTTVAIMVCPRCREDLDAGDERKLNCCNGHEFVVIDGVVDFKTREIQGECWSQFLKNYGHYLEQQRGLGNPRYLEGEPNMGEVTWQEIERTRPGVLMDIASGVGGGMRSVIQRINWPCTVIMTDLSHRILKWDRRYFAEEVNNPFVDIVYLACDCASIPLRDGSVDVVTSYGGFESMQNKMMSGFSEAYRVLKPNGHCVYTITLIEDSKNANTKRWMDMTSAILAGSGIENPVREARRWLEVCKRTGYTCTDLTRIYEEMPAPQNDVFPFENEILQWAPVYVVVSRK